MNILEQHIAELHKAQEAFNAGIASVHSVYAADVQRSRDKLMAALNGETMTIRDMPRVDMSALEDELNEAGTTISALD